MVYIKSIQEEIIDPISHFLASPETAIGAGGSASTETITLFDKQDVLINKIEKLPVLRGIQLNMRFNESIADAMIASASEGVRCNIIIYNGSVDAKNMLYTKNALISVIGGVLTIWVDADSQQRICYLLSDELVLVITLEHDDLVAGAAFPAGYVAGQISFDIDWVKVTEAELKQYAVEMLYASM